MVWIFAVLIALAAWWIGAAIYHLQRTVLAASDLLNDRMRELVAAQERTADALRRLPARETQV